jgi:hypothetical protein
MLASGDGMLLAGWAAARQTTLFVDGVGDDAVTGAPRAVEPDLAQAQLRLRGARGTADLRDPAVGLVSLLAAR